jgi:ubiquinone/menaquinone biosynthesis C-methylase UbiE
VVHAQINFGYPWFLSYGHLPILAVALCFCILGYVRKWAKGWMIALGALTLWSAAAFLVARFGLDVNGRLPLPTEKFLVSGAGRVLDMGAGTGRSTIMVLEARPQSTVVALDLFGESFDRHFGPGQSGQERLLANLKAAGVEPRAAIQAGDMRQLPFPAAAFDGVVSTYAIDHLNGKGITAALSEASRVLKPGGDFLMMVIAKDLWLHFTFGPLLLHSGTRSPARWTSLLQTAGLQMVEQGARPGTLYFLARKP